MDASEEGAGEFVEACGDAAILLQLVEEAFDEVALAVKREVRFARLFAIGPRRDDRRDASRLERLDEGVGVVTSVADECLGLEVFEQWLGLCDVGRLSRCERDGNRIAERVDNGVDLRCQAAARTADGLGLAVFF